MAGFDNMSDTAWREAARLLRQHIITPHQFIDALGEDEGLLEDLALAIREAIHWCSHCRECDHNKEDHGGLLSGGCSAVVGGYSGPVGVCGCEKAW